MSENLQWFADISVRIDQAGTLNELRRLQQELKGFESQIDRTEANVKGITQTYARLEQAQKTVRSSIKGMAAELASANPALSAFEKNFRKLTQMNVAKGSLDGKGMGIAQDLFRTNPDQANRIIAAYDSIQASGVSALKAVKAELDKAEAAERKLAEATKQRLAASKQNVSNAGKEYSYAAEAAGMDRAQAAATALSRANRELAAARAAVLQSDVKGNAEQQIAANNRLAQAIRSRSAAEKESNAATAQAATTAASANARLAQSQQNLRYSELAQGANTLAMAERRLADAKTAVAAANARVAGTQSGTVANSAAVTQLADANNRLASAQRAMGEATRSSQTHLDASRYAMYEIGAAYTLVANKAKEFGSAIIKTFMSYESQMSSVQRTSGESGKAFALLEDNLIKLGDTLPTSTTDLNNMAIAAGQLGISGVQNITAFTSAISKFVAISDTVTAKDAAESFGRLANLTGLKDSVTGYEQLASSVAQVGVNAAATDAQILKTSQEVAQAAAGANFAAEEIIGLSGAFASLGVPPERARSVINDLVKVMNKGLPDSTGAVAKLGEMLGITAEAAGKLWKENPEQVITGMARAMAQMEPEQVGTALNDMGIKGARAVPVFSALAKDARNSAEGMSVLETALREASTGFNDTSKLGEQYALVLDDLKTAWQTFANSATTLGAKLGATVAPALKLLLDAGQGLIIMFRGLLDNPIASTMVGISLGLGAAATAMIALRGVTMLASAQMIAFTAATANLQRVKTTTLLADLARGMLGLGGAATVGAAQVSAAGTATAAASGRFVGLKTAVSGATAAMGGPWVVAIAAVIAAATLATSAVENLGATYEQAGANIKKATTAQQVMAAGFSTGPTGIGPWVEEVLAGNKAVQDAVNITANDFSRLANAKLMFNNSAGFQEMNKEMQGLQEAVKRTGNSLAEMANTDVASAGSAFMLLAEGAVNAQEEINVLDGLGDKFKKTMYDQGVAAGAVTAGLNTYEGKLQTVEYIKSQAVDGTREFTSALWDEGAAADDASGYVQKFADILRDYVDAAWASTDASFAMESALKKAGEAQFAAGEVQLNADGTINAEYNFELADKAKESLKELQNAYYGAAAATWEATGSYQATLQALTDGRAAWIQNAMDMGFSEEQARLLADAYFGIPAEVVTKLISEGFDAATMDAQTVKDLLSQLPPDTPIKVTNMSEEVKAYLEGIGYKLETLEDGTTTVTLVSNAAAVTEDVNGTGAAAAAVHGQESIITIITRKITEFWERNGNNGEYTSGSYGSSGSGNRGGSGYSSGSYSANGGFTGRGAKWDAAGTVHKGEYVVPKKYVNQHTGLPYADVMGKLTQGSPSSPRYANGGFVSGGGGSGVVELGAGTIHALARAVAPILELDGKIVAEDSSSQYRKATRSGAS